MDLLFLDRMTTDDMLAELLDPAVYRGYLQTMSRFSGYSRRNVFLIYKQMPHAVKLADFEGWKKQHGRTIIRGSTSIKINVPIPQEPKRKFVEKIDPATGAAALDANGKRIMEEVTVEAPVRFKPSSVFDISQTEGSPVSRLAGDVMSDEALRGAFDDALRALSPSGDIRQIVIERLEAAENPDNFIADSVIYTVCRRFGLENDFDIDIGGFNLTAETLDIIGKHPSTRTAGR